MYPILVHFGPLGLRTLPVVWALGIYASVKLAAAEFRRRGLDPASAHDCLMPAVIGGLIGARLFYVLVFDPLWFVTHPRDLLNLWSGLAFPGALLVGWGVTLSFCRRRGIEFWRFADAAVPGLVLGQSIGALGSLLSGSGYGTPTNLPWAVVFGDPRGQAPLGVPLHPTQLYETLALVALFAGLWKARRGRRDGALVLLYLAGLVALAPLDFLRGDALWVADVVPVTLAAGSAMLLGTAVAWACRPSPAPPSPTHPHEPPELRPAASEASR